MITKANNQYLELSLDDIVTNPSQPRKTFDQEALQELSDSIKQNGVLQPILVRKDPETEQYHLIAGERRYRASKMAALKTIPAVIRESESVEDLELAITENLLREDLNPIEEAESILELKELREYTDNHIADITGKSRTSIVEILSLNRLPKEIKEACKNSDMPPAKSLLLYIAREGDEKSMLKAWRKYQKGQYSIISAKNGKKKKEGNKVYRWNYKTNKFTLSLRFDKEDVSDEEIESALKSAERNLKKIRKQELVLDKDEQAQLNFFDGF